MFKNCQNIAISKSFLISLICIALIFTSFAISVDDVYGADLNQSVSEIGSELTVEDKLENSQEEILNSNVEVEDTLNVARDSEALGSTVNLLSGGTFSDIRKAVNNANKNDIIKLKGTFVAEKAYDQITIDKKLTIMSDSSATLNAKGLTYIFNVKTNGAGTTFKNLNIINGKRQSNGGALYINATGVTVSNCVFKNNDAYQCGAIYSTYNNHSARNLLIENCKFIQNHASRTAAAVGAYGHNSKIINCTFDSNGVSNDIDGLLPYGGAIQIGMDDDTKGYVYDCKFLNNYVQPKSSSCHGGAGCVRNGIEYKNCIFINNSAGQGGALTFHASGLIQNCTFINNSAKFFGGALSTGYADIDMNLTVVDCDFEGNTAPIGGGVQLIGINVTIRDCHFDSNNASQTGGAINVEAETVNVSKSSFRENVANVDGGAIFINGKSTTISDSSFISNDAIPDVEKLDDGLGGAIYINSTKASINNNKFYYNTARNGSAVYYDKSGRELKLTNNTLYQNQAWVYALPIYARDIYYGETENFASVIHGGNNIAKYGDLAVSNAIYNAAKEEYLEIDGETPVLGATTSGHLYQDDREYNMDVLLTVTHEDGSVVYNKTLNSDCFGEVSDSLENLKAGKYFITAKHFEDTYYKAITNTTTFKVTPQVDDKIRKTVSSDEINYHDVVVWTLNVTNAGPSNATGIVIRDVLPEGLIYISDNSNGDYNSKTGTLTIDFLPVGEIYILTIQTRVNRTGNIVNNANVTANEYDYNLTNNHDKSDIQVRSASDLAVVKSANASDVNMGDLVKWTITVTNNGPDIATGVICSDLLPKSLIWQSDDGANKYDHKTGVWNIGTLGKGASVRLNIISKANGTGKIKNEVRVSAQQYDYDESNNYDSETVNVKPASDLEIVKLVSSDVADFGDVVRWTLVVSNRGPDAASGVRVSDVLPSGFVYLNSSRPYSGGVINIGSLAVGGSVSVDIFTRVNVTGSFVNVAAVEGNEYDPDLANNRANASVFVKPASDLSVKKNVNNSNPNYGEKIQWEITVTNNGPDRATGVVVSDVLPKSLIYVSSNGNYDKNTGKWNVGTLNKGASAALKIICIVNTTKEVKNIATVTGNEYDFNKSNNNDSKIITVKPASDLEIVKLVSSDVVDFGDVVRWTLVVSNRGPDAASGVRVSDVLPSGFVYLNSSRPYSGGVIDIGSLAVGGSVSVDIFTRVNVTGSFVNVAAVEGNEYDPDLANNRANASVFVKPAADLSVEKSVNESSPKYQNLITWTIAVTNNGPDRATGVVVSDVLPKYLIYVSSNGNYDKNTGRWNIGTLNKKSTVKLNIVCRVNATGVIENTVSVTGNEFDFNKSNNHDNEVIKVGPATDLAVEKFVSSDVVDFTDVVRWTLVVSNRGPDAASGVRVSDVLPSGFVYLNSSRPYSGGVIDIGSLAVGGSVSVDIFTRVNVTGSFVNVATVEGNEYDPDLANNRANASVFVKPASDLSVKKDVNNSNPNYGDKIQWVITVTNNGPDRATGVTVRDLLPESLVWIEDNGRGKYNHNNGVWNVGNLNKGESGSLIITVLVNATGSITNVVSVSGNEFDYNKSNNNNNKSVDVANASDLSVIKFANASYVDYHNLVKWTVIAHNNGPNKANGVIVEDVLPEGLRLVNYTATKGFYDEGIWNVCCIGPGGSHVLELICEVIKTGEITNFVKIEGLEYDPDKSNNQANSSVEVPPSSDLAVVKTVDNNSPNFGDVIEWNITVINNGPDDAEDINVLDILDDGLELISYNATSGSYVNDNWNIGYLQNGFSETLILRCLVKTLDNVENVAEVIPSQYDWNKTNNRDSEEIIPNPIADLSLIKLVDAPTANYLDLVTWTLIVTNYGPNDATGVVVSDVIPKGLNIVDVNGDGRYENSIWYIGDLADGETRQLDIVCKIQATGKFTNFASVWADQDDPDLENNDDETDLYVMPASDISITKTVSKLVYNVGDRVKFSIKLTNKGPDRAENVEVNEIMDDSLLLKSFHASAGVFDSANDVWSLDSLDVGETALLKIDALASKEGSAENSVSASSDNFDPDMSNNDDTVSIKVTKNNRPAIQKVHNEIKKHSIVKSGALSESILVKNKAGNPLMVLIVLFVFSFGAFCGRNIFKKP